MSEHEVWNELGNLYFMSKAYDHAAYAYRRSIQLDGSSGRTYSNLALAYTQLGEHERAIEVYKRGLELITDDKDGAVLWNRLGNEYGHLKEYERAFEAYQRADELDPASSESREDTDHLLYHSPAAGIVEVEAAMTTVDGVTLTWLPADAVPAQEADAPEIDSPLAWAEVRPDEDEPDDPELFSILEQGTQVYFPDVDEHELANWLPIPEPPEPNRQVEESFIVQKESLLDVRTDANVEDESQGVAGIIGAGSWLDASRGNEQPEEDLNRFVRVDVDDRFAAAFVVPEDQTAEGAEPALIESPVPESATMRDGDLNIELEIPKLKKLVQINPYNAITWNTLGNLYRSAGLYKEAIRAYQQATSIDPAKSEYHHNLGMVYGADGRDEDAIISLQKVLELNPDHSLTHATLGGYYRKMGLDELAQKHIGRAMKHIYDSESEYNRACLEAICGNADQAIELLRVALQNKQTYVDWVLRDPDLDAIREDRRFKQLISDFT
ncbi:MAG TPA: tetratricopeptide repeat protein [Anaerolineales bacterium]|jgi:tetratricopeptide (TPR) repeat protein